MVPGWEPYLKTECKRRTEEYQVTGPECAHDITEYFSYFVLFIHRMPFGGEPSMFA